MTHFSPEEWRTYGKGPTKEKDVLMEKHLLDCDACLQLFLDSIDDQAVEEARALIPPDFTARTCGLLRTNARKEERRPGRSQRKRLLACYAVAAAITIMLCGGGVFQSWSDTSRMNLHYNPTAQTVGKYEDILFNWPARLQEISNGWLNNMEIEKHKEVK
ncbi:MAG: hypothetical protein PHP26_11000 [Syntrophomonas sp.]|uniref:hypothetical protein n=1 Tax=Syntrophomonas sp. TaxID=2053627 RepID=UPI00261E64FE|nr:hypothetical protein [Syntrophomonas sp.]MDD2511076.1 hypothetical protein [Syntrophomonas sp.]MDD3880494.1 hypothetical protein [Syntrophomonas sp.]MDD4627689.1 hypothetical protein [Syntrophomonas sp.]